MTTFDRLQKYDRAELIECGAAFTDLLNANSKTLNTDAWQSSAKPWTDLVLNWFTNVQDIKAVVDTSGPGTDPMQWGALSAGLPASCVASRRGTGEFLKIDLLASLGPQYTLNGGYWREQYWDELLRGERIEPLMALESEWKGGSAEARYSHVMHSAAKLASVRARAKVLVFASYCSDGALDSCAHWLKQVGALRRLAADASPWLVIDVPWRTWSKVKPQSHVLHEPPGGR